MSDEAGAPEVAAATGGDLLRAAREERKLRLDDLAASLKVPRLKLELLEANRYDELPSPTFTRALAFSVCRALKMDAEPVLARLPRPKADELAQFSLGLNAPFKARVGGLDGLDLRRLVNLPLIAGLVLALGAATVYWLPMGFWSKRAPQPSATQAAAPTTGVTPPGEEPAAAGVVTTTVTAVLPEPAASVPVVVDTVFSAPAAPADAAPVVGGVLMLRAAAESWVEVRDAAGRVLLSRSLAAGEAAGLDGALPLRVVVGNAEATQVTFKGQPVALGASRDNVARLELK
ncbi:MAG TPA: helix-turn-helix domain-containing protein [Methylibium sp.]|uniref:helix-turn-helix domain-containing protein n=1 Tax=Methylibium sp. TaxID=2067992 RepID=UPI002DBA08D8|nr:helix-turn-helix domain-containing protein [Methylibium sp.]HEU4460231.1 helix-turn-helix domain-containing protein [Methylibium sp.]